MNQSRYKIFSFLFLIIGTTAGFLVGRTNIETPTPVISAIAPEISLVRFKETKGDELHFEISGPVRVIWSDQYVREGDGDHTLPLGQIPNQNDLELQEFQYLGNAKTKKFYPSTSYPARGTEVRYRRFFNSKKEAIQAGFIPSKLVK